MMEAGDEPSQRPFVSTSLMLIAVLSFTILDSTAKFLSADLPIVQLVWARYLFSLLLMGFLIRKHGLGNMVRTNRPILQIFRALLLVGGTGSIFFAVKLLPLAETYAISFVSPIFAVLFAIVILGENVGAWRWYAIGLGFCGILIVIQPGTGAVSWAAIFPLLMAIFWALYQVLTRFMSTSEAPVTTLFYTMFVGAVATTPAAMFVWVQPGMDAWLLMFFMGLIGMIGQLLLIKAYAGAQASLLAPFTYTQIIWAALIGYFIFDDEPGLSTLAGAAIVVMSGLFVLRPEVGPILARRSSG